jgi:hypothetical protein
MSTYAGIPKDENAVMTFEEIGRALGTSPQAARQAFERGISKLVRYESRVLGRLLELSELSQQMAAARGIVMPADCEEE